MLLFKDDKARLAKIIDYPLGRLIETEKIFIQQ
jgi:hypothetical protein